MKKNVQWFVLIGDQEYGPYEYKAVIHMIQNNQLMDFNYVLADHLKAWTPMYQLEEFSRERLRHLVQYSPESFIQRKSERIEVRIPLVGHNSSKFFEGEIVSISDNGALCRLNSPDLKVGDVTKLQLEADLPFTVEGEVIRKSHSRGKDSGLFYSIKFLEVPRAALEQIKKWSRAA